MGLPGLMADTRNVVFSSKRSEEVFRGSQPWILKSWLEVPDEDPNRMTKTQMWSEGFNLMIAGPGGTAAALIALVFQLGSEEGQFWQEKLRSLIVDYGDGSEDPGIIMTPELNAAIKETLRLHAPFPTAFPRVITPGAEEGVIPHTKTALPVGTMVSANTYVLGRSEETWGSDADKWLPQRWLGSEARRREMENKVVAFSKGSRRCIGRDLALLVIKRAVVGVIRNGVFRCVGELKGKSYLEMRYEECWLQWSEG